MSRVLAVDFGLKRIGLALSDENRIIASPLEMLPAGKTTEESAKRLIQKAEEVNAKELLIGNPLHLSGKSSFLADEVKHFVTVLQTLTELPIKLWDERLTSTQAERALKEGGINRKKRTKLVDSLAAVILLQSYLDSQNHI